jgi:hypothetical protein
VSLKGKKYLNRKFFNILFKHYWGAVYTDFFLMLNQFDIVRDTGDEHFIDEVVDTGRTVPQALLTLVAN